MTQSGQIKTLLDALEHIASSGMTKKQASDYAWSVLRKFNCVESTIEPTAMRSIILMLPIPSREISPNARRGESRWAAIKKSKIVKQHRLWAKNAMLVPIMRGEVGDWLAVGYSLRHFFETAALRDDDNADGACKAYRDGICDALGINDKRLRKVALSEIAKDTERPRVEITLYFEKPTCKTTP